MSRTIAVRGTGRVTAEPDCIELNLTLESRDPDYGGTMEKASGQIGRLNGIAKENGFDEKDLKTSSFQVSSDYEGVHDENGVYREVFRGYICTQAVRLRFRFDMARLASLLNAIGTAWSGAEAAAGTADRSERRSAAKAVKSALPVGTAPRIQISFTVLDPDAVSEALLRAAAADARENARILCDASGVRLGRLESIRYHWDELNVYSRTRLEMPEAMPRLAKNRAAVFDAGFTPEEVKVTDSAEFIWEIE